jgi:pyrimidine oxygenase
MDYGLFIPIANDGWIASTTSPSYMPTFELNKMICQRAEAYGFEFALSMIKLRGYGGATEHWDYALESFTLMAGLAAVTEKMKLYASIATPTIHPAMVARMATTIDSIAPGRFGVNIVAGWNKSEYQQMGLWPGDEFYEFRYDYASEYVEIMRQLWTKGQSDFKGRFFQLEDCVCKPLPGDIAVISAGASDRGRRFTAEYCDYNFTSGVGGAAGVAETNRLLAAEAEKVGRTVKTYMSFMVILGESDADAKRKIDLYEEGVDIDALQFAKSQAALDVNSTGTSARIVANQIRAVPPSVIAGSPASVAAKLNEIATIEGIAGIMLRFDDFLEGVEVFGSEVMPLLD